MPKPIPDEPAIINRKTCFVIQGLGYKTDFSTGRVLNLDASYAVIKEAIQEAGLTCVRIDEVLAPSSIDRKLYEWLFRADLVIADLSTYNLHAVYELGIRYGLRPEATIVVAESQFRIPFDLYHVPVEMYEHLGSDLGRREAERFKERLKITIQAALQGEAGKSPVYELMQLDPPTMTGAVPSAAAPQGDSASPEAALDRRVKPLVDAARRAMMESDFVTARQSLAKARLIRPDDPWIVQQLALATYKSRKPEPITALNAAQALLQTLEPETTSDFETLGLWGAVNKRLWDETADPAYLDRAIAAYDRGFTLTESYYNGINLAFLLDVRAPLWSSSNEGEGITDAVVARRIRRLVITICEKILEAGPKAGRSTAPPALDAPPPAGVPLAAEERFWLIATLLEASVGIGDQDAAAKWREQLTQEAQAAWMLESAQSQIKTLSTLLAKSPLPVARGR